MVAVNDAATTGRAETMTVDHAPSQDSKTRSVITTVVRAVTQPAGKNVDWQRVSAVGEVIGALAAFHGLKTRIFGEAAQTPENKRA